MFIENLPKKETVLRAMDFYQVPGAVAALLKGGETVFSECYGHRGLDDRGDQNAVRESTLFGIASVSKSFTSALIAMLVDEGKLDYDVPVKAYLSDFKMFDPFASEQMTLRDMLYHRTGLSGHDALWTTGITARSDLAYRLRYLKPAAPFRYAVSYNSTIYAVIGYIAEAVTGKTWDALVRERIFKPLGFADSLTSVKDFNAGTDFAKPYYVPFGEKTAVELPIVDVDTGGPAAGLNASLRDVAKWISFHIGDGKAGGRTIISKERLAEMHEPGVIFGGSLAWDIPEMPKAYTYGMGWFGEYYRGHRSVWHAGEINGYCSLVGFLPDDGVGYVVMANRHKPLMPFVMSVKNTLLDAGLGLTPIDWIERLQAENENFSFFHYPHTLDLTENISVPDGKPARDAEAYAGVYNDPGYGKMEILADKGGLKAVFQGVKLNIEHLGGEMFKLIGILEDVNWFTAPLEFVTDTKTGKVRGMSVKLDSSTDSIEFVRI
ncbi:MAG: serine hydrolase [Spirochaetaceae bacterium]|jgi:CubicO group peptidase (beta-lactamase class C family)|nr:serine hydrolase [Spirochaetaceae bacterium]